MGSPVCCAPTIPRRYIRAMMLMPPCPEFNPAAANKLLDDNGWVKGADGVRTKGGAAPGVRVLDEC